MEESQEDVFWRIGQQFRAAREQQGYSLAVVSREIRIPLKTLELIESGDWTSGPGIAFVRGFLRNYGKFLKLDAEVVRQAQNALPQASVDIEAHKALLGEVKVRTFPNKTVLLGIAGASLLIFAVFMISFSSSSDTPETPVSLSSNPAETLSLEEQQALKLQGTVSDDGTTDPETSSSSSAFSSIAQRKFPLQLRILASERAWLGIQLDNESSKELLFQKGESFQVGALQQVNLTLGNSQVFQVFLNEKKLHPDLSKDLLSQWTLTASSN